MPRRDWGLKTMNIVGKLAGLMLGLIALYVSAVAFQAVAPPTEDTETSATPYEVIFTHAESMALALTHELVPTITAYGIDGPAPAAIVKKIAAARAASASAHKALQELAKPGATSRALGIQLSELNTQATELAELRAQVDADLSGTAKNLRTRTVMRTFGTTLDTLLTIERLVLFTTPPNDTAGKAALHLRHNLLTMLYYGAREAAALGDAIASGTPISPATKEMGSYRGGQISTAWNTARSIGNSGLFDRSAEEALETIQTTFFDEFTDNKFELYDLSDDATYDTPENEDDVTVDYYQDSESWLDIYSTATAPVLELLATAKAFKPTAEVPSTASVATQNTYAILFLLSLLLVILLVVSLFIPATRSRTAKANTLQHGTANTRTDISQLAKEARALADRIANLER